MRGGYSGGGEGSKVKVPKTSGGRKMPVRHTIPLGIVIFLVCIDLYISYYFCFWWRNIDSYIIIGIF